jgi:hypothetical protein
MLMGHQCRSLVRGGQSPGCGVQIVYALFTFPFVLSVPLDCSPTILSYSIQTSAAQQRIQEATKFENLLYDTSEWLSCTAK